MARFLIRVVRSTYFGAHPYSLRILPPDPSHSDKRGELMHVPAMVVVIEVKLKVDEKRWEW
jgi:hypothetical protein